MLAATLVGWILLSAIAWILVGFALVWCVERNEVRGWWSPRSYFWILLAPFLSLRWTFLKIKHRFVEDRSPPSIDEIMYGSKRMDQVMQQSPLRRPRSVGHPTAGAEASPYSGSSAPTPHHDTGYPEIYTDPGIAAMRRQFREWAGNMTADECHAQIELSCKQVEPSSVIDLIFLSVERSVNALKVYSAEFKIDRDPQEFGCRMIRDALYEQIQRLKTEKEFPRA